MGGKSPRHLKQNALIALTWLCLGFCCATACGCGYTFATTPLSSEYETIAVPAFHNRTKEENLQIRFNNILVRELVSDGRLRVVDNPEAADLVLSGTLTAFNPHAVSLIEDDEIGQFRITVVAAASLRAGRTSDVLWQNEVVAASDFYLTLGGRTREEAVDEALEELAEQVIYQALDNFW